jgi:hypothetical protein
MTDISLSVVWVGDVEKQLSATTHTSCSENVLEAR